MTIRGAPAWRLVTTLAVAGAMAGLLIVVVFEWAQPRIEAHQAAVLAAAIDNVLAAPARYDTLYVVDGALRETPPEGVLERDLERVFLGYDESDVPVGFAVTGAEPGYQDVVRLIFGYDPGSGEVVGMEVLESKETPGLGDRIEKDAGFVAEFDGVQAPLVGVKQSAGQGDPHEVDMITGATISSRTVIAIINHRLEELGSLLDTYPATVKR